MKRLVHWAVEPRMSFLGFVGAHVIVALVRGWLA